MKKLFAFICVLALCISLSGCGNKNAEESAETEPVIHAETELKDILSEKWSKTEEISFVPGWEIVSYHPLIRFDDFDEKHVEAYFTDTYGDTLYTLLMMHDEEGSHEAENTSKQLILKETNILTMEESLQTICGDNSNQDSIEFSDITDKIHTGRINAYSMDIYGDVLSILFIQHEDKIPKTAFLVDFDLNGVITAVMEIPDIADKADVNGVCTISEVVHGANGEIYFYDTLNCDIYSLDAENGCHITKIDLPYTFTAQSLALAGNGTDNTPIFYGKGKGENKTFFCVSDGTVRTLYEGALSPYKYRIDRYGNLLMITDTELIVWNIPEEQVKSIYRFSGLDTYSCIEIMSDSEGKIVTIYGNHDEVFAYSIARDSEIEVKEISVLLPINSSYIESCASYYMITHPGVKISIDHMENTDFRGGLEWNLLAENIKDGVGPDIIMLSRRQLDILVGADVLCPLDSLLSDDIKENIFAGAYKFGEYGELHYAVPLDAYLNIYKISSSIRDTGSFSVTELMDTFDKAASDNPTMKRVDGFSYPTDFEQLIYDMCIRNIENSEFVDLENNKCNFETENFYRLLRFCKENKEQPVSRYFSEDELVEQLQNGESFMISASGSFSDYSRISSKLGDEFANVYLPSADGTKAGIEVYWGVAVNKLTDDYDVAGDFINFMLSEKSQLKYTTGYVRRDVIQKNVKEHVDYNEDGPVIRISASGYMPLYGRKDGSSYADEYIYLMDHAVPISSLTVIHDIIFEESGAYGSGAKDEYETAKVIQNRIQLYLDERG
ncbi:MAG: extracellular solute-binding protein [Lachnospiraceae bacterium]|nr:extracellular solute-binding protein [Lachnospiraceae bacterium]